MPLCEICEDAQAQWQVVSIMKTYLACDGCCEKAFQRGAVIEAGML